MYCGNCGTKVSDNATFCPKCGNKLRTAHETSNTPLPQRPPTPYPYRKLMVCAALAIVVVFGGMWIGRDKDRTDNQHSATNGISPKVNIVATEESPSSNKVHDANESIRGLFGEMQVSVAFPNFEELSVGRTIEDADTNYYFLFNKEGNVTFYMAAKDGYMTSGFFDGMCMVKFPSGTSMIDAVGKPFKPAFLNKNDEIIYYGKDTTGVTLWTVRREDLIDGSNTILTAWSSNGEIKFQCDSNTSDLLAEFGAKELYDKLLNYQDTNYALQYQGGAEYSFGHSYISRGLYCGININGKSVHELDGGVWFENGWGLISSSSGNMAYVSLMDEKGNIQSGWNSLMYSLKGPLSEGLFFLQGEENKIDGKEYPAGFYDINLKPKIDLSKYHVLPVANEGPRFINGYAVLQLENDDHIKFWGVIDKNGNWTVAPQKGKLINIIPSISNLIIRVEDVDIKGMYTVYDALGTDLSSKWASYIPSMYNGYADMSECFNYYGEPEVHQDEMYMCVHTMPEYKGRIIKINKDGEIRIVN